MCQLESTPQEARLRPEGKPLCVPRIPETKPETAGFPTPRLLRSPFPGDLQEDRVTSRAQSPSDRRTGGQPSGAQVPRLRLTPGAAGEAQAQVGGRLSGCPPRARGAERLAVGLSGRGERGRRAVGLSGRGETGRGGVGRWGRGERGHRAVGTRGEGKPVGGAVRARGEGAPGRRVAGN